MSYFDKFCCPYCAELIAAESALCTHCGKEIRSGLYAIVPDGSQYAISFQGKIKVQGLTLERAKRLLAILNQYLPE